MNKRILIVDDEPNVRLSYRAALELEGGYAMQALLINKDFAPAQQDAKRIDELARRGTSKEPFSLGRGELGTTG